MRSNKVLEAMKDDDYKDLFITQDQILDKDYLEDEADDRLFFEHLHEGESVGKSWNEDTTVISFDFYKYENKIIKLA